MGLNGKLIGEPNMDILNKKWKMIVDSSENQNICKILLVDVSIWT